MASSPRSTTSGRAPPPGDPEPQPDARPRRRGRGSDGPATHGPSFRSRWVSPPRGRRGARPRPARARLPRRGRRLRAQGRRRHRRRPAACDEPGCRSALLLTRNAAAAAPMRVCRDECDAGAIRAVVVNSGNANAATGEQGYRDALAMRDAAAEALEVEPRDGGGRRDRERSGCHWHRRRARRVAEAVEGLAADGGEDFTRGDHDHRPRAEALHRARRRGDRLRPGQGGGDDRAGLRDHALLRPDRRRARRPGRRAARGARRLHGADHRRRPDEHQRHRRCSRRPARRQAAPEGLLDAVLLQLALEIVADGEGATRVGRVEVAGAADAEEAERVARAIANSPLVKTALFGRDPNWGRIAQAAGMALAGEELEELGPTGSRPRSWRRAAGGRALGLAGPRRRRAPTSTSATSPTTTSGSTRSTRHERRLLRSRPCSRRCPTSGSSTGGRS